MLKVESYFFKYATSNDWILKDINFELNKGEVLLLLGPNGSGKTTLALSIMGIAQRYPSEYKGTINYKGRDILEYKRAELAKTLSIIQQDPEAQIVTLIVEDEVAFALENLLYDDIEERISRALKLVRLEEKRKEETYALSYGEKQKLMLASILALDNELLVLDEPTSNLDPLSRKEFFKILYDLKARKTSMLIIEHNIDEIAKLIDKVLILNKRGEVMAYGSFPNVLYELDKNTLVELGIWLPYDLELQLLAKNVSKVPNAKKARIILKVENLSFKYKQPVLRNINIDFEEGKLYAILGHNGAGKTTLCKIIAGLLKGYSGKVRFLDSRKVKFCFQNPDVQLIGNTVKEEIGISLKAIGKDPTLALNILRTFNLEEYYDKNPHMLSEGQKRILSIASALVYDSDVLICDEPTFALDRANSRKIMEILKQLTEKGKTVIYTTHDIKQVLEYADEVITINKGMIEFKGDIWRFIKEIKNLNIPLPSFLDNLSSEELEKYVISTRGLFA